ncbi:PAS domain-containing protein [Streptomyces sp. NPDC048002]|uniref:PAS domain-containing protein n=1 Tax=unclassified Streptomyces TaxID=2593676 RepID=UPI0033FAB092
MSVVSKSTVASSAVGARAGCAGSRRVYTAHACPKELTVMAAEDDFAAQFGLSPGELCGRSLNELLQAGTPTRLKRRLADLFEGRTTWFTERVSGRHDSARAFTADLTAIAVTGPDGPSGLVLLLRPLTGTEVPRRRELTLSELDARLLEGVAGGASTVQLAGRLYLSRQGVEYRVGLLLRRFDAPNRPALVARAHGLGMFAPGQWPPLVLPDVVE